jgi:parvulin-like peptidyl-prolyl isomerase
MQTPTRSRRVALLAAVGLMALSGGLRAGEVIDRVVAVVSGSVITLSEARAAIALGFVDTTGAADPLAVAVKALVDREIVLDEVNRSAAQEPDPALVTQRVERIRARFADQESYRRALASAGIDEPVVQELARDDLRVRQYIERRFEAVLSPSDDEVSGYYLANPAQFTREGQVLPLDEVRSAVVARFVEIRRQQAIDAWMIRLRRRADVVDLYLPRKQ